MKWKNELIHDPPLRHGLFAHLFTSVINPHKNTKYTPFSLQIEVQRETQPAILAISPSETGLVLTAVTQFNSMIDKPRLHATMSQYHIVTISRYSPEDIYELNTFAEEK